jgi:hypothetical protein
MTELHFMVLAGIACLAPHFHPIIGNFAGLLFIILAAIKGLGWL